MCCFCSNQGSHFEFSLLPVSGLFWEFWIDIPICFSQEVRAQQQSYLTFPSSTAWSRAPGMCPSSTQAAVSHCVFWGMPSFPEIFFCPSSTLAACLYNVIWDKPPFWGIFSLPITHTAIHPGNTLYRELRLQRRVLLGRSGSQSELLAKVDDRPGGWETCFYGFGKPESLLGLDICSHPVDYH